MYLLPITIALHVWKMMRKVTLMCSDFVGCGEPDRGMKSMVIVHLVVVIWERERKAPFVFLVLKVRKWGPVFYYLWFKYRSQSKKGSKPMSPLSLVGSTGNDVFHYMSNPTTPNFLFFFLSLACQNLKSILSSSTQRKSIILVLYRASFW